MNPFDLRGPQFLLFFGAATAVILGLAALLRRWAEGGVVPKLTTVDPYLIACLRAGQTDAIKLAVLSLIERDLLVQDGHTVKAADGAAGKVKAEIEQCVLEVAATGVDAGDLLRDAHVRSATRAIADDLAAQGLTPSGAQRNVRMMIGVVAFAVISIIALAKLTIAFRRGHHNVGFLVLSWLAIFPLLVVSLWRRQSRVGQILLADLGSLFEVLRWRQLQARAPHEQALVAAVYGLDVGFWRPDWLFVRQARSTWGASGSGGGSCGTYSSTSCGSSGGDGGGGGSSCGGGCGGGGCGGCGS